MRPLDVVEADPIFDNAFGLEPALQFMQVYGLLFERLPQPFDEDVDPLPGRVMRSMIPRGEISASFIHRYLDVSVSQSGDPG